MRYITTAILASIIFIGTPGCAQESEGVAEAQEIARMWLALTDASEYARSWEQAASLFQSAVTKSNWESAIQTARFPLGSVKARKLKSAVFTRTLPGAPDGEYVVIQYESQFERKANAIETVTPMRERDGSWKVSGYFIK